MNLSPSPALPGRVASLHLHPPEPGAALRGVSAIQVVEKRGIIDDCRYFDRISRKTGQPSRRQVSLIERELIDQHAAALGLVSLPPGVVRANIETLGVDLVALVGQRVRIGEAILHLYEPRTPCEKMDAICSGLRERMQNGRQGVLAEVVRSGTIHLNDAISVVAAAAAFQEDP